MTSSVEDGVAAAAVERMMQACIKRYRAEVPWEGMYLDGDDPFVTTLVHPNWRVAGEQGQVASWHNFRVVDTVYLCPKREMTMLPALVLIEQKCGWRVGVAEGSCYYVLSKGIEN